MLSTLLFLLCAVVAYLIGSVCSAVIVSQLFDLPDPRLEGSQNPGATNVLRLAGKQYALIVLIADMLKGLLPVLLAKLLDAGPIIVGFTCFAAVLGHMYPIFFKFRGGKGVATALGALLGFHFLVGVAVIATWLVIVKFSRYVSFASIVSLSLAPLYSLGILHNLTAFPPLMCIALFIIYKHRNNITRLLDGTEPKLNLGSNEAILPKQAKTIKRKTAKAALKRAGVLPKAKKTATVKTKAKVAKPKTAKTASKAKAPAASKKSSATASVAKSTKPKKAAAKSTGKKKG
jgi:acyl phosphate:glycerol-3-phosphate acyltransferase